MSAIDPFTSPCVSTNSSVSWLRTSTSAFPSPTTSRPAGAAASPLLTSPAPGACGAGAPPAGTPFLVAVASDRPCPRSLLAAIAALLHARSRDRLPRPDRHRHDVGLEVRLGRWPQPAALRLGPAVQRGAL